MRVDPEFIHLPVHSLITQIDSGRLSSRQIVQAFLDRIERYERDLNAFVSIYAEHALRAAAAADESRLAGHRASPLHGIPIVVKDLMEIEGTVTTAGSKLWATRQSTCTATLARKIFGAGMVLLGKTHTVEFAMGAYGTNKHLGTPRNPWDFNVHRAPGGSSSGTGVAVAASLAPWGIGTDTGGSVRTPSSWCGLTGLRVTSGRISCNGFLQLSPTFDTAGPMCRDVEDCALLLELLQGPDPLDPRTLVHAPARPFKKLRRGVSGTVLGTMAQRERELVDGATLAAYDEAMSTLKSLGAHLVEVQLPHSVEELGDRMAQISGAEAYAQLGRLVDDPQLPLDHDVRARIQHGRDMKASEYVQRLRERSEIQETWEAATAGIDALLWPTTATAAPRLQDIDQSRAPSMFSRPISFLNWCALALPDGVTADGMPLSLQIACSSNNEEDALRIGWAFQQATDWHRRLPSMP